jgi:hypothetical protein
MSHKQRLLALIARIISSNGFIKGVVTRGDHLFVPKQSISYEEAINRAGVPPTPEELKRLAALAPLDSSVHIKFALADAGFQLKQGQYVHDGVGLSVLIKPHSEGDDLYITTK